MNNKGQFSIIAALLVAIVLIGSVMTTYSAIRYSPIQEQPQILSSTDESNQALNQILGFTVGYYGSVLRVTGNVTYAQQLANNYFDSGLTNVGSIKPEWGLALNKTDLSLKANWFTNDSYSQGDMNVTYDLNGLGITGVSYTASTRLEVQVSNSNSTTQAQFKILTDNGQPLINLGASNIQFYNYVYGNLTWDFSTPTNIVSHGDGTYVVDLPPGVSSNSYVVQVEDTRGLSVLASSFSQFKTTLAWNTTGFTTNLNYVNRANLNVLGTHSNFTAQQYGPDSVYDTLTEVASGTTQVPSYPTNYNLIGSTKLTGSGTLSDLQNNDGSYMSFKSYKSGSNQNAQVELTGNSATPFPWNTLNWTIDGSASTNGVTVTFQLYNSVTGYPNSGDGYMTFTTVGSGDLTMQQLISANPANYVDSGGNWKVMVTAVKSTSNQFNLNLDFIQYSPNATNYALNLQEQWANVNATNLRQDLCIKTGSSTGTEPLVVQVLHGGNWMNLTTLNPNYSNNVSLAPYIDSTTLTIRFLDGNNATDPIQDSWNIDAVYLQDEPDINFLVNLQQSTFTLELLQNGTMRWLGQNMQLTTQTLPIPPIPVKAIHVNQTVNGVNQEVPFQIEDWASNYQIPLGLTSNTTLFGNRQMLVFLLNSKVTDFTVWWNGSDTAYQTPLAYTDNYFKDSSTSLNNGNITLTPSTDNAFTITSQVIGKSTSSTTTFMRINTEASTYGAGSAYVICNGTVRDIIQQEAEWGQTNPPADNGGAHDSPNLYASIVLTLPAGVSYYTYQLRLMFINSTQARTISDICPIQISTTLSPVQTQTENGALAGSPIIQNGTGTFLNSTSGSWTAHHFSQLISDSGKGVGIMFTDTANQKLYAFDSFLASTSKGALKASAGSIEMDPVVSGQVSFTYAYDVTWQGAVETFDGTTPICNLYDGTTPMGLWILVEYPPMLTVTPRS